MKHNPNINPQAGDRVAKVLLVKNRKRPFTGVFSRTVLAVNRYGSSPKDIIVVWTRKLTRNECRCTLAEWRAWARQPSL